MTASMTSSSMMIPYLHFTGGDYLFLQAWQPKSAGALTGACLGLLVLGLFERWIAATRGVYNARWRRRALALMHDVDQATALNQRSLSDQGYESSAKESLGPVHIEIQKAEREKPSTSSGQAASMRYQIRTTAPFIPGHDIPRGILYACQMLVLYALMLAVMTFQAAFIIAIILGLSIGETIFGRFAGVGEYHHH